MVLSGSAGGGAGLGGLEYICSMTMELRDLAADHREATLVYLLEMAAQHARERVEELAPATGRKPDLRQE